MPPLPPAPGVPPALVSPPSPPSPTRRALPPSPPIALPFAESVLIPALPLPPGLTWAKIDKRACLPGADHCEWRRCPFEESLKWELPREALNSTSPFAMQNEARLRSSVDAYAWDIGDQGLESVLTGHETRPDHGRAQLSVRYALQSEFGDPPWRLDEHGGHRRTSGKPHVSSAPLDSPDDLGGHLLAGHRCG